MIIEKKSYIAGCSICPEQFLVMGIRVQYEDINELKDQLVASGWRTSRSPAIWNSGLERAGFRVHCPKHAHLCPECNQEWESCNLCKVES